MHDYRADRNFTQRESALRLAQSFFHPKFVGQRHGERVMQQLPTGN
jgi:hypothetical protein